MIHHTEDTGIHPRAGILSPLKGPLSTADELSCNSPLNPEGRGAGEMPCSMAPTTIWSEHNSSSLSTNWNMASPGDTALSFQPVEPATKIQGDLKFSISREPTPRLCFITWGPSVLFCKYASIKSLLLSFDQICKWLMGKNVNILRLNTSHSNKQWPINTLKTLLTDQLFCVSLHWTGSQKLQLRW